MWPSLFIGGSISYIKEWNWNQKKSIFGKLGKLDSCEQGLGAGVMSLHGYTLDDNRISVMTYRMDLEDGRDLYV